MEAGVDVVVHLADIPLDGVGGDAEDDVGHAGQRQVSLHGPVALSLADVDGFVLHGHIAWRPLAHDGDGHVTVHHPLS